jgi:sigma-B regulation protein RsbU (phosphoserine phosphatase)
MILGLDGSIREIGTPGTLLGPFEEIDVRDATVTLEPGEAVIMVTDGVLEADRAEAWQAGRLPKLLASLAGRPAAEIVEEVLAAVGRVPEPSTDDVAILVVRLLPSLASSPDATS